MFRQWVRRNEIAHSHVPMYVLECMRDGSLTDLFYVSVFSAANNRGRFFFLFSLSLCCCFCFRLSWWCRCCCIYGVVCARVQVPHQFFIFFIHCHFGRTIHVISTNSFGCCYCCCCCLPAFSLNFLWATGAYLLPIFLLNPTWAETSILLIQFQHRTLC